MSETFIDREFLRKHRNTVFVFGDNLLRKGTGGAAALRNEPNTYGFITKKEPKTNDSAYYRPDEYKSVFEAEYQKLVQEIRNNRNKLFLISRLGAGLANKYKIWEEIVEPRIYDLADEPNVILLWTKE